MIVCTFLCMCASSEILRGDESHQVNGSISLLYPPPLLKTIPICMFCFCLFVYLFVFLIIFADNCNSVSRRVTCKFVCVYITLCK